MLVGMLTTSFPRWPGDTAGCFVEGFARALASLGHRVEVLCPEPVEPALDSHEPGIIVRRVPYMRPRRWSRTFYGAGVPDNLHRSPLAWLGLAPFATTLSLSTLVAARRWSCTVSHWALPCALVAAAMKVPRPHLAVFHSADLHLLETLPMRRSLASWLLLSCDSLLFVATAQRERFLGWLSESAATAASPRCHVQPMGIDPCSGSPCDRELLRRRLKLRRFALLSIARLVSNKGLELGIRALTGRQDLEWIVVGSGPEQSYLQRQAALLGAPVRFVGEQAGSEKHAWLHACDAYLCTSRTLASGRSEGMPTALLEALRCGLPLITSDTGGIPSILQHEKQALMVPENDVTALGTAIDRLRASAALRATITQAGQQLGRSLTWPTIAPTLEAWLR